MARHTRDKYLGGSYAAAQVLKYTHLTFRELLEWLEKHLLPTEEIQIHQWVDDKFYIEVHDNRGKDLPIPGTEAPGKMRIGFTIQVGCGAACCKIIWNNDPNITGNNWIRSNRWKKLMFLFWQWVRQDEPKGKKEHTGHMYFYRDNWLKVVRETERNELKEAEYDSYR